MEGKMSPQDIISEAVKQALAIADGRYVKQDSCSERHEKTDEKITEILVENSKMSTKMNLAQWLGGIAAGGAIGSFVTGIVDIIRRK